MKTLVIAVAIVSVTAAGALLAQTQGENTQPARPLAPAPVVRVHSTGYPTSERNFESLTVAHATYTEDFAKKPGFGSGRILYLPSQDLITLAGKTYRFDTPELVGLENDPVVYRRTGMMQNITVAIMSKAELRSRLTRRGLTAVESNAIVKLRAGKDLITQPEEIAYDLGGNQVAHGKGIRAIGALRAQEGCAKCHGVKEGTLLGAFSYSLIPTNLVAVSTPDAIRSTKPQTPQPRVTPAGGTNLNITMAPNAKKAFKGSIASVGGR